tara:strand:+ start:340 stop:540 length:201 start_codon:yes stop_codon:yes gene_type:complete
MPFLVENVLLILDSFVLSNVLGYIDPGSGSLVIQMLIGALVGAGITIKIYWYKLKTFVFRLEKKDE